VRRPRLLLLLLVPLPGGCGREGDAGGGPLGFSGGSLEYCAPATPGSAYTFGEIYLDGKRYLDDNDTLTLRGLSFAEIDGLTLLGAVIAPESAPRVAAWRGYPPEGQRHITAESWAQTHRPLEGAVVPRATEVISIGLRLDAARGYARTALLDYEFNGRNYQTELPFTYQLRRKCSGRVLAVTRTCPLAVTARCPSAATTSLVRSLTAMA
jgi:hypothetical protein